MTASGFRLLAILGLITALSGCAGMVGAVRDGPIEEDPGKRSFGRYIDDQIIETKVLVNIRESDPGLADARIRALSFNGVVLLVGQIPDSRLRQRAADIAARVKNVRKVHNELELIGRTAMLVRSNDNWITTKVKSRFTIDDGIDSGRIKVTTENSTVYLMGIVSRKQGDRAAQVASEIGGVKRVVRVFEYL